MAKCFIFAIGGTGSRVLFSLTNLMAAGCFFDSVNIKEIVPVIIDMHEGNNSNKQRAQIALRDYTQISDSVNVSEMHFGDGGNRFFRYKVNSLKDDDFNFNLPPIGAGTEATNFNTVINFTTLNEPTRKLVELLIPNDKLNDNLNVGFKGVPSLGSVVMNDIRNNPRFIRLFNQFQQGDRIVIIGSLFGGTGASGIPVIAKTIRECAAIQNFPNAAIVSQAPMAAIMVLPYFTVQPDGDSPINSDNFIRNTKAALKYYERNGNIFNSVYYVADQSTPAAHKVNDPGDGGQKNNAHFAEVIAAKQVFHFLSQTEPDINAFNRGFEYGLPGVNADEALLNLSHINDGSEEMKTRFSLPLIRFYLAHLYLLNHGELSDEAWLRRADLIRNPLFGAKYNFLNTQEFSEIQNFMGEYFRVFLSELSELSEFDQSRGFRPFTVDPRKQELYASIKHINQISIGNNNWNEYTQMSANFADFIRKCRVHDNKLARLLDILYRGICGFMEANNIQ